MAKEMTYEELAQKVSEASNTLYLLSKQLEAYHKAHSIPGEKPMRVLYIASQVTQNSSFTLETVADEMLARC